MFFCSSSEQYDEMKSIVEAAFARMPGSVCKRDALLKWCAEKLNNYGILITNFSNSWTDGIAFCSLLHSYMPDQIDLESIKNESKVEHVFFLLRICLKKKTLFFF